MSVVFKLVDKYYLVGMLKCRFPGLALKYSESANLVECLLIHVLNMALQVSSIQLVSRPPFEKHQQTWCV